MESAVAGPRILRLEAAVLAVALALAGGLALAAMTAWLVMRGGENVGAHLGLLGNYFWGYSVSWSGALVGFGWGAAVGAAAGWFLARVYNAVAGWRGER